jgi:hypothetical protein
LARPTTARFAPSDIDNNRLANLCGAVDQNLRLIEANLDVRISRRGETFTIEGEGTAPRQAATLLRRFYQSASAPLSREDIQLTAIEMRNAARAEAAARGNGHPDPDAGGPAADGASDEGPILRLRKGDLQGRSPNQRQYLRNILGHDLSFGIGPAGTGKTFLAVACAADALERDAVERIVLTRPAVEAGERLGFLPGDLSQKVDPYLRPLQVGLAGPQRGQGGQVFQVVGTGVRGGRSGRGGWKGTGACLGAGLAVQVRGLRGVLHFDRGQLDVFAGQRRAGRLVEAAQKCGGLLRSGAFALDREVLPTAGDTDLEVRFDQAQVLVDSAAEVCEAIVVEFRRGEMGGSGTCQRNPFDVG